MNTYKQASQIFDKWENDKTYIVTLVEKFSQNMDSWTIYAKDIREARRLSQFHLGDTKLGLTWKIMGVEPKRN